MFTRRHAHARIASTHLRKDAPTRRGTLPALASFVKGAFVPRGRLRHTGIRKALSWRRASKHDLQIEPLEERRVLAATLSFVGSAPSVQEGDSGQTLMTFTFRLTGTLEEFAHVDWRTLEDSPPNAATEDVDFAASSGQHVFPPGSSWTRTW